MPNFFGLNVCDSLWKLAFLHETRIETKKVLCMLEFNQSQWLKPNIEFHTQKKNWRRKKWDKDGKALYKVINNAVFGKKIGKLEKLNWYKTKKNTI